MSRLIWAVLAALALGCGSGEAPAPASRPAAEERAGGEDAPVAGEPLEAGDLRVERQGDRLTLEARGVPVDRVLGELAAAAGVELEPGAPPLVARLITARIADASLVDVLAVVLRDTDFSLELRFDASLQRHVKVLRLGPAAEPGAEALAGALFQLLDSEDPEVVLAALEAMGRAGDGSAIPEIEPLLDDEDPAVREAAAATLDALSLDDSSAP